METVSYILCDSLTMLWGIFWNISFQANDAYGSSDGEIFEKWWYNQLDALSGMEYLFENPLYLWVSLISNWTSVPIKIPSIVQMRIAYRMCCIYIRTSTTELHSTFNHWQRPTIYTWKADWNEETWLYSVNSRDEFLFWEKSKKAMQTRTKMPKC